MVEADSTSPWKKQKTNTHNQTTLAVGQTTHNVEQDRYGHHIHPTTIIPIPFTTSHIHGEICRSIWVNIDFSNSSNQPYIIPYQLLQFWTGQSKDENQSIRNLDYINNACYGITWH
jgi:hypothetical protein